MRDYIFRGKKVGDGRWVQGHLLTRKDKAYICPALTSWYLFDGDLCLGGYIEVDPATIGQFTGLTDKSGKKIFEGDIFKFPDEVWESYHTSCGTEYNSWETENYGVVGFSEYYGRYDFVQYKYSNNTVDADMHENNCLEFFDFILDLEVIGNIHDNPELLKGENE